MTVHRARLAAAAALAVVLLLLAASEFAAARDRAGPGEATVDGDVEPARRFLTAALTEIERTCAGAAALALRRTEDVSDASTLFAALEGVPLPEGAGIFLEDGNRRVLAWAGATIDDGAFASMPRTSDGSWFVRTPSSRRVAVRRTRATPRALDGVPVIAVCHVPFEQTFPLRNRAQTSMSLEDDAAREFRIADEVRILAPDAAEGDPVPSSFGGAMARIDVRPLPAEVWDEAVDAAAARRRAAILAALVLVAAIAAWREISGRAATAGRHVAHAGIVVAARLGLAFFPLATAVDLGPLTDASRYNHALSVDVPGATAAAPRSVSIDLAGCPASLLLTCAAVCLAAACLLRAARRAARTPGPLWRSVCAAGAAAFTGRFLLAGLVHDTVSSSTVQFFAPETVLPHAAPALLLGGLLLAGIAAVMVVQSAWCWLPPVTRPGSPASLGAVAVLALLLAPIGPEPAHPVLTAVIAFAGIGTAVAAALLPPGAVVRAAAVPLGVAVGLFAPLDGELHVETRRAVESEAASRVERTVDAERLLVARALDAAAQDPDLLAALRAGSLPRDLALTLWVRSPLSGRAGGSSLEIRPAEGLGERQVFSADLPPRDWLPDPAKRTAVTTVTAEPLPGRESGADGRWLVGDTRAVADGGRAADLRIVLEVRPPTPTLPELQVLDTSHAPDAREAPPLAASRYGPDGRLVETDDPYRPAGAALDAELRRTVIAERRTAWRHVPTPDRDLEVFVRPDLDEAAGGLAGVHAFSFDAGGTPGVLLRATRAALCGALASIAAMLATVRSWLPGARLRLAQRLVVSYILVSALPLTVLGLANREIATRRADESTKSELTAAISLLRLDLHGRFEQDIVDLPPHPGAAIDLREIAYSIGHHANVFRDAQLVAASDQGLFDTELLPTRLPGSVYHDVILLGRPLKVAPAAVGDYVFDVGYAPLRSSSDGRVIGAVSVPLLHQRRVRERELASAVTAVLGLYLASLVAAVAVGTWLARRLTKPLSDLTEAARRVARGDLEHPVPGAGPDELGEVVASFNQMQSDLGESRAKLVKAEKEAAWRDMARQVAHEVKNPLTPMRLAAEHLRRAWRDKAPNFDEVLTRGVDLIVRQTESLQRIATAFSDFARFPARRREPVNLPALVEEALDLWRQAPDLTIERRIERPLPMLSADPDELRRVVVNLAKNAVEAMEGRTGHLTVSLVRDGASLVLTLADDGPGIPDDVLPRLFEPYLSTKTKGTGLGLAICKRAIDDLAGTIAIRSRAGEGTTVTVRVPLPLPADGESS